jgi:GTPase Era involved in 16S rRNA processing
MERRLNKDFIEVEIIAEKESQKGVLIGKVCLHSPNAFCLHC